MFSLAVHWVEDLTSSQKTNVVELLRAVGLVAGRVCVMQSITPGKAELGQHRAACIWLSYCHNGH